MMLLKKVKVVMTLVVLFSLFSSASLMAQSWKAEGESSGIKISSKIEPGNEYKTYKGVMTVSSTEDKVLDVMRSVAKYPSWMHGTLSAKVLKPSASNDIVPRDVFDSNDSYTFVIYTTNEGAPLGDRDAISKVRMQKQGDGGVTLRFSGAPDYIAEKGDFVRVKSLSGLWKFEYVEGGKIRITHELYNDPNVSSWIPNRSVNSKTKEIVEKSLQKLKGKL